MNKFDMDRNMAEIIMRGLAYAMDDEDASECAIAEFENAYYDIGEAFGLLDEEQLEEMDSIRNQNDEIIAEYTYEDGYQRR